jgi:saccharopine dehydrogenase-like NADP-dependent oxidoreductase
LGGAPGIDNVLVRAAADQLDEVEEIHTSWIMSGADPGGHALSQHLLYSLAGRGLTKTEEGLVEIQSFRDGGEFLDYPEPIGRVEVFHIGHPEPITLSRSFPSAKIVDNKATFVPASVNQDIVSLGKRVRNEDGGILATEAFGKTMDDAATELLSRCREQADVPVEAGILVMLKGQKRGKSKKVYFSSVGKLGAATGVPAAIGAIMVAQGKINVTGCMPPELGIDAHDFLFEILDRRNLATLNGWVED